MGFFDEIIEPDWDGDGKHTVFDDMIEYGMLLETFKDDRPRRSHDPDPFDETDAGCDFDPFDETDDDFDFDLFDGTGSGRDLGVSFRSEPAYRPSIEKKEEKSDESEYGVIAVTIVFALIMCLGAMVLCMKNDWGVAVKLLLMSGAIGISILALKLSGVEL